MSSIKDQDALKNLIRIVSQGNATKEQAKVLKEVLGAPKNKQMDIFLKAKTQGRLALDYDGEPIALERKSKSRAKPTTPVEEKKQPRTPVTKQPKIEPIIDESTESAGKKLLRSQGLSETEATARVAKARALLRGQQGAASKSIIPQEINQPEIDESISDVEEPLVENEKSKTKTPKSLKTDKPKIQPEVKNQESVGYQDSLNKKALEARFKSALKKFKGAWQNTEAGKKFARILTLPKDKQLDEFNKFETEGKTLPSVPAVPKQPTSVPKIEPAVVESEVKPIVKPSFRGQYEMSPSGELNVSKGISRQLPLEYDITPFGEAVSKSDNIIGPRVSSLMQNQIEGTPAPKLPAPSFSGVEMYKPGSQLIGNEGLGVSSTGMDADVIKPFGGGMPPEQPISVLDKASKAASTIGTKLSPAAEKLNKGFKYGGIGLAALDVGGKLYEGDVGGALVSGGLAAAPYLAGTVSSALAAPVGIAAGVAIPKEASMDVGEDALNKLRKMINSAQTPEEKATLQKVFRRTYLKTQYGLSDADVLRDEENKPQNSINTTDIKDAQTYKRPESVELADKLVSDPNAIYADFIGNAESNNNYNAINKSSGAIGKYQILEKDIKGKDVHGKAVEQRYGMSFKDAMSDPAKQEDYFNNVLLPQYRKDASELAKTPEAKERGLDEFTLTGMMQLGKGNVINFLHDNVNDNIADQMYYFQGKADQYKRHLQSEKADIGALKEKEQEWQESGRYIPFKSAQAKMDTIRSGENRMGREEFDAYNKASKMREQYETQNLASYIPFKSPEDKTKTLEEQTAISTKEPTLEPQPNIADITDEPTTRQKSRLEEALDLQRQYEMLSGISRGSERFGRGLAGAIAGIAPSKMSEGEFEEGLTRMGKQEVEGAKLIEEQRLKDEETDPNSSKSKRMQQVLVGYGMPETDAKRYSYKDYKDLGLSTLLTKATASSNKEVTEATKRMDKMGKDLVQELARRNTDFGTAASQVAAVNNMEALMEGYKSLDDIPQNQIVEIARGMDKVVSGGNPTISVTHELTPKTAASEIQRMLSYIQNRPKGAKVGEFIHNYADTLDREKIQAQKRINKAKQKIVASYKDLYDDSRFTDRMRYIFNQNDLNADDIFNEGEENSSISEPKENPKTTISTPLKPTTHEASGIPLYDIGGT